MATDYYVLLGVDRNCSEAELKRAYRRLAVKLHPDANGGDAEAEGRFKEVTLAYETLRDPERRRRYDLFGTESGPGGIPGDMFAGGIGDLFESFFGGGFRTTRPAGPRRGDDVETRLVLRFEEAVFGTTAEVSFRGPVTCAACAGSGAKAGTMPLRCPDCGGVGQVRRVRQSILGQVVTNSPCPRCRGVGETIDSPCPECHGEGRHTEERVVTVEVPAGVDDGTTLRVAGNGTAAFRGGLAGDLYVHLRVAPHEHFERDGTDLRTVLHVATTQAVLGAEVDLETLDGTERITIPPGTPSGQVFRLRSHGVPHVNGRGRGDLHVEVAVDTPTDLSSEEEELLRELARLRGEAVAAPEHGLFSRIRSSFA